MKRMVCSIVAAGAVAAAALVAGTAMAKELIHGSWPPAVVYLNRVNLPKTFKEIDAETKGAVKWKLVPGGQLANPRESFQATSDGLIQGALGISTYVPNLVPSLNSIYSTIIFDADVIAASGAAMETFHLECPSCLAEFKKINISPISGWTSSQYYLACRAPYSSVEDLKGKRIRATGGYSELWKLAGAVPVTATLPEAVTLLQRGGLDCENGVHTWLKTFGYADFAKYLTDQPVGLTGPAIGWMINRDAWNGLTREQKMIHLRHAAKISGAEAMVDFDINNGKDLELVMKTKGVKLVEAKAAGFERLNEAYDREQRVRNIENATKFGVSDPAAIITSYKKNIVKWKKLTKDLGRDASSLEKYQDLFWTEIYSKVDPDSL